MSNQTTLKKAAALNYDPKTESAPKVVAKGSGEIAQQIIAIAEEHKIPIKKDETMIELLSKLDIDQEIPPAMYKAVAELFSFIYKMSNEKK